MALPGDLTVFTLTLGPYTDAAGTVMLVGAAAKLFPVDPATGKRLHLVHVATGAEIIPADIVITIGAGGTATVGPLPHTDNATLSTVGFAYKVEWQVTSGRRRSAPDDKMFAAPEAAGASVDYDLLDVAEAVPGVLVAPSVLSVNGDRGTVVLEAIDVGAVPADPVLSDFVYSGGNLTSYKEDGITITLTYNADGTVATSKRGSAATKTYHYSGGNLDGVA